MSSKSILINLGGNEIAVRKNRFNLKKKDWARANC